MSKDTQIIGLRSSITVAELRVLTLGKLGGMSAKCISQETGVSVPRVYKILGWAGISLRAYRNGETPESQKVLSVLCNVAEDYYKELEAAIKQLPNVETKQIEDKK